MPEKGGKRVFLKIKMTIFLPVVDSTGSPNQLLEHPALSQQHPLRRDTENSPHEISE